MTGHFLYRRREFITLLGGAAAAWPLAASAQQPAMPVVGFLASSSADAPSGPVAAVHLGLKQDGYELGQTVRMEYRYANNQLERLPALAAELVRIPAAVIVTSGGPSPTLVAKASTTTIPIVFAPVPDPVRSGLVTSFNRPGGNITGVAALTIELDPKRLELLHELTPSGGPVGALLNPSRPEGATVLRKQLRRAQVLTFFSRQRRCLVGLEACATAHYWAGELRALGHEVRLMPGAIREGLRQAQ